MSSVKRLAVCAIVAPSLALTGCSVSVKTGNDAVEQAYAQKLSALLSEYGAANASGQQACLQGPTRTCGEALDRFCVMLKDFRAGLDLPPGPPPSLRTQNGEIVEVLEDFLLTCSRASDAIDNRCAPDLERAIRDLQAEHSTLGQVVSDPALARLAPEGS